MVLYLRNTICIYKLTFSLSIFPVKREHKKSDLLKSAEHLRTDNMKLEAELMEITRMIEKIDQESAEERKAMIERQTKELDVLKKANQMVKVTMLY